VKYRQGWAGEKSGPFEHPAGVFSSCPKRADYRSSAVPKWFFRSLLDEAGVGAGEDRRGWIDQWRTDRLPVQILATVPGDAVAGKLDKNLCRL